MIDVSNTQLRNKDNLMLILCIIMINLKIHSIIKTKNKYCYIMQNNKTNEINRFS